MKKTLLVLGIVAIFSILTFTSEAARTSSNFWKMSSGDLVPTTANEKVTVYDLEITNAFTLGGTVGTGGIDMNGEKIDLDADADTSITADTDDQIDIEIGNADDFQFIANEFAALSGSDISLDDNGYLYFDTAKAEYLEYSSAHGGSGGGLLLGGTANIVAVGALEFYANTAADAAGNWDPYFSLGANGVVKIVNTSQGSAGDKYLEVDMTDGVKFNTGGAKDAFLLADNVTTADKTFQFPDVAGTIVTTAGAGAAINLGAYDLSVEGASGIIIGKDAATNTAGVLKLWSAGATDYYNTFTAGTNTANATYTLPVAMPASDKFLQSTSAGVMSWAAASSGGLYGMNVETLSAGKTLTPNSNKIYQYLDEGGANRIITLATAGASAGDRFVIRHNGAYNDDKYLEVKQSTTSLDKIYAGAIKEFIFDGSNWICGETGSGEALNGKINIGIGYYAEARNAGLAIGNTAIGHSNGIAIGQNTNGYSSGVAVGKTASGNTFGTAVGYSSDGANYGIAIGYNANTNDKKYSIALGLVSECERVGELSRNINGDDTDQENNIITQGWEISTANNTPVEMLAGGQAGERFTIRASSVVGFTMTIVARDNVAGHVAMYTVADGIIKRDASNNTAMAAAATVTTVHEDDAGWAVTVTADDTNEALIITVTGDDTNATQWAARADLVETHF